MKWRGIILHQELCECCIRVTGEKPYKCMQCGRMFVSMGVLKAHIKTHTGAKDYKCHICDALFTTNGSLTRHMSSHVRVNLFKCNMCPETFATAPLLKRHSRRHKGENSYLMIFFFYNIIHNPIPWWNSPI